jgi:hypothetical protein
LCITKQQEIMCNLTDNFMEDALYHQQLKQEYEYRMWEQFIEEQEQKEKAEELAAIQYFKDLEKYETSMMEREYRELVEWDLINN